LRVHLFNKKIIKQVKYHNKTVEDFFMNPDNEYASIKYLGPDEGYSPFEARTLSMEDCLASSSQFYFALDSTVHLDNPDTLKVLIEQNRGVISPVMIKPGTMWSNVWGAVAPDGYYKRSYDYYDIIQRKTK
jgi:procollagen-lysine,2-oxoglutarate 5-dioxygenase